MKDVLKPLLESELLTEEAKEKIEEAWSQKLSEAREEIEVNLREEFAARYEHDKGILVESLDRMVEEALVAEIAEFSDDRRALAEKQVKLAEEIREARITSKKQLAEQRDLLETFVLEQLAKEIGDFEQDRKEVREAKKELAKQLRESRVAYKKELAKRIGVLENFVLTQLKTELTEFHQDKKALVEQRVKMIKEGKAKIEATRKEFIKRSANLVEETLEDVLRAEMTQFREDIESSRKKAFGMQMFEAFAAEYKTSFFHEDKEVNKLKKRVDESERKLTEAAKIFDDAKKLAGEAEKRQMLAESRAERTVVMNELLNKLSGKQKDVMAELLEGIKTGDLRNAFKKYIPAVTNGTGNTVLTRRTGNNTLNESRKKVLTGDKQTKLTERSNDEADTSAEIVDLQRLAGIQS